MGQYLKKFGNVTQYDAFAGSANFLLPNVSYIVEQPRKIRYNPRAKRIVPKVTLKYNATENKLLAFNSGSDNIKKLKIDGREISIEPSIVENHEVNVYASAITIDYNGGGAGFPSDYVMSSMPNELRLKPMDPSVKISEVPDIILLGNVDGMGMAEPLPMSEALGHYFEIDEANNQLVSLSALREEMGMLFDYGYRIGFILGRADYDTMEMEVIDCVQMYAETEGGLQTPYYFSQAGQHTVEMELNSSRFGGAMMFRTDIYNDVNSECGLISAVFGEGVEYISDTTFYGITTLKTLTLTKTILSIEDFAFYKCSGLTSLSLNNGIVNVGESCFSFCYGLKGKLTIPNSLRYIANGTFNTCTGLTSVSLGSGLTSIGTQAFGSCRGLTGNLIIPNSVTSIGEYAFDGCSGLTGNLIIPNSVTSIGSQAFQQCYKLSSLSLGSGLTSIGNNAFNICTGLTGELVIPDSVTGIGEGAFRNCSGLTSLVIPDSVTSIGSSAFTQCYKLSSLSLGSGLTSIGEFTFYICTGLTGELVIPDSVTSIGNSAFSGCGKLPSLKLGSGLTSIGNDAFYICTGLTGDLIIPNSVTSIGTLAFYSCYNFNSIVVSAGNTAYDSRNGSNCLIETSGNTVLLGCKTSVIPNTATSISDYAFYRCSGLTGELVIPDSVTSIGISAFTHCSGLTSLTIGSGLTTIGNYGFAYCRNVKEITIDAVTAPTITSYTFYYVGDNGDLIYPEGSDYSSWLNKNSYYLGYYGWNKVLTTITCTYNVENAGVYTKLCYSTSYIVDIIVDGVSIGTGSTNYAFSTTGEHTVEFTTYDDSIPYALFSGCTGLTSVIIPDTMITIGDQAFNQCSGLTSIVIPDSVTSIGTAAFYYCSGLTSVIFGSGLTTIGKNAFSSCKGLTSIVFPASLTSIGSQAFWGCSGLTAITCHAVTAPTISSDTFINVSYFGTLNYPEGSDYSQWLSTDSYYLGYYSWNKEPIIITCTYDITTTTASTRLCNDVSYFAYAIVDGVKYTKGNAYTFSTTGEHTVEFALQRDGIPRDGFRYSVGLISVDISDSVTYIDYYAFSGCTGLTTLSLGSGLTNISYEAFQGCSGLTGELVLPDSVTNIGGSAFGYCKSLTSLSLGSGLTSIGRYAFSGCRNLTGELVLPDSVTTIDDYAFSGCRNLTDDLIIPDSVTSIGINPFIEANFNSIVVSSGNSVYDSRNDCNCIIETSTNMLITGCKNSVIPNTVTSIGNEAFSNCNGLTSIVIPDSVTSIGGIAFSDCSGLISLTLGSGLTTIGGSAFYYCNGLKGELVIPDSVTTIGYQAFIFCNKLTSLSFGSGLTSIGEKAFQYCSGLTEITCHAVTAPTISYETFNGVSQYGTLNYPEGSDYSQWLSTSSYYLGYYKWNQETYSITCTYDVTGTTSATKLYYTTIGAYAMVVDGTQMALSNSYTFSTTGEHTVEFKMSATTIGASAFTNCYGLTSVSLGNGLTFIGDWAFSGCTGLTSIDIPDSVTSIGNQAFRGCRSLMSVSLGSGLTSIGNYAFSYCSGLTEITCNAVTAPTISSDTFKNVPYFGTLNYPDGSDYSTWLKTNSYYLGYYSWNQGEQPIVTCTYDVTTTTAKTRVCWYATGFTDIVVDGVSIGAVTGYTFSTTGEHTVEYKMKSTAVHGMAFDTCHRMISVDIPDSVTSIGNYAFQSCSGLTEITCNAVTAPTIGSDTFKSVSYYGTLNYPEGSDYSQWLSTDSYYLGYYGWNKEPGVITCIYDVTGTTSATKLCGYAAGFTDIVVDGVSIGTGSTGYTFSTTGEHTVEYKMKTTSIGYRTFEECYGLTSIVIPDSVTSIGVNAFYRCTGLTSIVIPDSVSSIGDWAFNYCRGLTSIEFGSGLRTIGERALYDCYNLTGNLIISSSLTSIDGNAFAGTNFNTIVVSAGNTKYDSRNNCNCIIETSTNKLITGCKTSVIPNTVTTIGYEAFRLCRGLTSIVIPDSVTSIGGYAFYFCDGLTSIEIPDSVTSIGGTAFQQCYKLSSLSLGSGLTSIGSYAFSECSGLTSIVIPDSVISIEERAFNYCTGLTSASLGSGLTSIGNYAFSYCNSLTEITCNATTAPTISNTTFVNVSYYGTFNYPEGSDYSQWLSTDSYYLGYYKWNQEAPILTCTYDVTTTTAKTTLCDSTTGFTDIIVDGVSIGAVTGYIFSTTGEHTVEYKMKTTAVPNWAFSGCTRLTSVVFSDLVTGMGSSHVFSGCYNLTSVTFGTGLTGNLSNNLFSGCKNLKEITCNAVTAPTIRYNTFEGVPYYGTLNYPDGSDYSSWLRTDSYYLGYYNWNQGEQPIVTCTYDVTGTTSKTNLCYYATGFTDIVVDGVSIGAVTGYTFSTTGEHAVEFKMKSSTISASAFTNCYRMISVDIPDSVTSIGTYAFYRCSGLTGELVIPDSVTSIGNYAFTNCSGLIGELVIPNKVTSIGSYAFYYCTGLTGELVIPDTVTSIGTYVFYKCSGLTSIELGSGLTSIGGHAFSYCSGLTEITCNAVVAPTISNYTFSGVSYFGTLNYPEGSDYSEWLRTDQAYLGYYGWNKEPGVITCTVNVTGTTSATKLCHSITGFTDIVVDGVSIGTGSTGYTFSTTGEHTVEYKMKTTKVPYSAFTECYRLISVEIPDSVTHIDNYAFYRCTGLRGNLVIPDSVAHIGKNAFHYCAGLTSVSLGSGLTTINDYAFSDCYGLTGELVIPDLVRSINDNPFYGSNFNSIVVSAGNTNYDSRNNCNCIIKTSDNILRTGCKNSVIPNTVTSIGRFAFGSCSALTSIVIPDSVTSIGEYAFRICDGLTSIVIPDSVKSISQRAFEYCRDLTSVILGSGLTRISDKAFQYCSDLTEITCNAPTAPTIYSYTFSGVSYFGTLNYPEGSDYSQWLSTDSYYLGYYKWNEEAPIVTCTFNVTGTTSATKLCRSASGFTDIVVDGVSIGTGSTGYTFSTTGEHTVEYKMKTTKVPYSAFTSCYYMVSVDIPDSVTGIGDWAFRYCTGLTSVSLGSGLTRVGGFAFSYCSGLTEITCHAVTAPTISNNQAFADISYHGTLNYPSGSDYSEWLRTDKYYLGYYGWTGQTI